MAVKFGVTSEPPVFQTGKASSGPNPETTVLRGTQGSDVAAGQLRSRWRVPRDAPKSIEPEQAGVRANPEIAIGRLSNGEDDAGEESVADLPRGVRVLSDVEGGVQRERTNAVPQENRQRDDDGSSHARSIHHRPLQ